MKNIDFSSKTKILAVGDIHTDVADFAKLIFEAEEISKGSRAPFKATDDNLLIVQVGDWGIGWENKQPKTLGFDVAILDGNHEYFPLLQSGAWEKANPNVTFLPRGCTLSLAGGVTVGVCGGAESIDAYRRTPGYDWFPDESISMQEAYAISGLWAEQKIHAVIAHEVFVDAYPQTLGNKTNYSGKMSSPQALQMLYEAAKPSLWIHGHHHNRHNFNWNGETRVECLNTITYMKDDAAFRRVDNCCLLLEVGNNGLEIVPWGE